MRQGERTMRNRIIKSALAAVCALALSVPALAAEGGTGYADVP